MSLRKDSQAEATSRRRRGHRFGACSSPTAARSPCASSAPVASWAPRPSPSTATPTRRAPCPGGGCGGPHRTGAGGRELPAGRRDRRGRAASRARRPSIRATASCPSSRRLAEACAAAGIVFVGPTPATLAGLGDKLAARRDGSGDRRADRARHCSSRAGSTAEGWRTTVGGGGRADRLPAAGQGGRRRRRTRHAPRRRARDLPTARGSGRARGAGGVRRRLGLPRALRRERAPRRGAAAGRRQWQHRRPGRAGLLGPAAPPEAGRGGTRARPVARLAGPSSTSWPSASPERSACATPRRRSSCWRRRASSGSSRSTRGCRSSTA